MNGLKFTVKLFATIAVLCLGLNLIAGELDGRWSKHRRAGGTNGGAEVL